MNDNITPKEPVGDLQLRVWAMPADANPYGDIFGGWVLAQMDTAGGIAAVKYAEGRIATVAIEAMQFHQPIHIGDVLCVYTELVRVGTTSFDLRLEAWALRDAIGGLDKVTQGLFTYVALDETGRPRPVELEPDKR